jgi:hypothetical protein
MKYTVRRHGKQFKVYETSTKNYIQSYLDRDKAKSVAKSLNNGSGFNGEIPNFFYQKVNFCVDKIREM